MTYKCHGTEWFIGDTCIYCQLERTTMIPDLIENIEHLGVLVERKRIADKIAQEWRRQVEIANDEQSSTYIVSLALGAAQALMSLMEWVADHKDESVCDCGCGQPMPMDICSSECDDACAADNHGERD